MYSSVVHFSALYCLFELSCVLMFLLWMYWQGHPIFHCFPPLVESGPHEEAGYLDEDLADDASEVPSAYSPADDIEESAEDEDEQR